MTEHEHPFGHEPAAIATRRVLATGGVLALVVIGIVIVLHFALRNAAMPNHAAVAIRPAPIPPPPRLQPSPQEDLAQLRADKARLLSQYMWTDAGHHYARIPIARAMELYARQHVSRPAPAASTGRPAKKQDGQP